MSKIGQGFRSRIMQQTWKGGKNATLRYKELVYETVQPGMRILHAGCGWDKSNVTRPYKERCHVVGIDLDPRVESKYHSEFYLASISMMPFADESFDIIVSEYVMEHVEELASAFREMARVLKPAGCLLLLTPNLYSYKTICSLLTPHKFHIWTGRIRYGEGHEADMYPTVYRCNSPRSLVRTALASGFKETSLQFVTNGPTWVEKAPILFEGLHLFHLTIARWERARQLRCALILKAKK